MTCLQLDNVRRCEPINSSGLRLDEVDGVLHREDLLSGVVRNLATELFFESHDQLDGIKAVSAQIVDEAGALGNLRFFDAKMLTTIPCTQCSGHFISHTMDLHDDYVCGMCNVPSRAGKTRKAAAETMLEPSYTEVEMLPKVPGKVIALAAAQRANRHAGARPELDAIAAHAV